MEELAEERAAARPAIRRLHLVPVWYESGAPLAPPQNMYRAYLEQSQIFVGIYWQRFTSIVTDMEISRLEDEFRLAAGKPMGVLKRPAPDQEPGLTAMIDGIRSAGAVFLPRHFATAKELERLLHVEDLAVLLSEEAFAGATILPSGTVTFLFTDIAGSTRLFRGDPKPTSLPWPSTEIC